MLLILLVIIGAGLLVAEGHIASPGGRSAARIVGILALVLAAVLLVLWVFGGAAY